MGVLLLIRHGQASFGTEDYDRLSPLGHRQAELAADELRRRGVTAKHLRHGSLLRQRDTAAPFRFSDATVDERWNEYRSDDLMTAHSASAARLEGEATITSRMFQDVLEGALRDWYAAGDDSPANESWPAFRARVDGAITDAAAEIGSGETGIVVTSAGVIAAVCATLTKGDIETFLRFNRTAINAGITKITVGRGGLSLVSFNEHGHLEGVAVGEEDLSGGRGFVTYR